MEDLQTRDYLGRLWTSEVMSLGDILHRRLFEKTEDRQYMYSAEYAISRHIAEDDDIVSLYQTRENQTDVNLLPVLSVQFL